MDILVTIIAFSTFLQLSSSYDDFRGQPRASQLNFQPSGREAPGNFFSPGFNWGEPDDSNEDSNNFDNNNNEKWFKDLTKDAIYFQDDFPRRPPGNPWNPGSNRRNRPSGSRGDIVDPTSSPVIVSTVPIPGMATTRSPCENACRITPEYNPVCGTNGVTYTNDRWLRCAQNCGRRVEISYYGACPRVG